MNKQQLKLYYIYFIPITILQSISTLLMMTFYSVEDYGAFNLYLTNINIFFFLTLGLQLGYTLKLNKLESKHQYTSSILIATNLLAIAYTAILVIISFIVKLSLFNFLSALSGIIFILFIVQKSIFQTNFFIHKVNLYTLAFRLIFLFDIVFYIFNPQINQVLIFDVGLRLLLVTVGNMIVFIQFKPSKDWIKDLNPIKETIVIGLPIMLGNWITMLYLIADKYVLRDNLQALGLYSFAITFVLLLRVLITPIKDLLFVTMAQQDGESQVLANTSRALLVGSLLTIIAGLGIYAISQFTSIFMKYDEAMASLFILLSLLPLTLALDLFLYNHSRVLNQNLFLIKSTVSSIVLFLILFVYVQFTTMFSLELYSLLVVLGYNLIFLIFSWKVAPNRKIIKQYYWFLGFELVYLAIIILTLKVG